jgi:hypothetical protein
VIRDIEQAKRAKEELEEAKAARASDRMRRVHSYGILNRKQELSAERMRKDGLRCTCGALVNGTIHKEDCPVVREARSKRL